MRLLKSWRRSKISTRKKPSYGSRSRNFRVKKAIRKPLLKLRRERNLRKKIERKLPFKRKALKRNRDSRFKSSRKKRRLRDRGRSSRRSTVSLLLPRKRRLRESLRSKEKSKKERLLFSYKEKLKREQGRYRFMLLLLKSRRSNPELSLRSTPKLTKNLTQFKIKRERPRLMKAQASVDWF